MSRVLGNISTALIGIPGQSSPQPQLPQNPLNPNFGGTYGIGIRLNGLVIGGVKRLIEDNDLLDIPSWWEYNVYALTIFGDIDIEANGMITIMDKERNGSS